MSIIDPSEVGKAGAERDRPARMDPNVPQSPSAADVYAKQQQAAQQAINQRAIGNQLYGGLGGLVGGGVDPAYEAERKAREDRDLRSMCLEYATRNGGGSNVVTIARQFYDFIKGN